MTVELADVPASTSTTVVGVRTAAGGGASAEQAAVEEAGRQRLRELRRLRKQDERVGRTTVELLKVLSPAQPPQAEPLPVAGVSSSPGAPAAGKVVTPVGVQTAGGVEQQPQVRLAFTAFAEAMDGAVHRTTIANNNSSVGAARSPAADAKVKATAKGKAAGPSTSTSSGITGESGLQLHRGKDKELPPRHSSGELYCRKLVAQWPLVSAATLASGGNTAPLNARDQSDQGDKRSAVSSPEQPDPELDAEIDVLLVPLPAETAATRGKKVGI